MDSKKNSTTQLVKERNQSNNNVKLCGYLKKKRNKVGGWRKMWFVLQDKLLLSYASKEEYDNKLVSFKDVLNLVPGTLVRPLGGFRFTIETTSHSMYTFHCDDRTAYREWIAVLLDSLAGAQSHGSSTGFVQRFHNVSADNIPYALRFNAALQTQRQHDMSNSCDSIRQHTADSAECECYHCYPYEYADTHTERVGLPTSMPLPLPLSCVRLPIARTTAKILERNGVNSSGLPLPLTTATTLQQQKQQLALSRCERNSGTQSSGIYVGSGHFRLHRSYSNKDANDETSSETLFQSRAAHPVAIINRMFQQPLANEEAHIRVNGRQSAPVVARHADCDHDEYQRYSSDKGQRLLEENAGIRRLDSAETCSCSSNEDKALDMVKDKIQRMSIKGCKESLVDDTVEAVEQREGSKLITTKEIEEIVMEKLKLKSEIDRCTVADTTPPPEPIYAVVDLQHKYEQRKLRNNSHCTELNRCNSYDSIMQSPDSDYIAASRTRRKEKSAGSLIGDDIDGIYEDGDALFHSNGPSGNADDENIYEPINVPTTQPKAFWKYFTHLKMNSFLHLTRIRKRGSATYDTIELPVTSLAASPTLTKPVTVTPAQSSAASQFSNIKRKFGTHRKSMQVRVRKLCARAYEPKPFFKHHRPHHLQPQQVQLQQQQQQQAQQCNGATAVSNAASNGHNNNNKKSKYRWKSVKIRPRYLYAHSGATDDSKAEKQRFFGSLPHLRKTRTSIFASNHLHLVNDSNAPLANNSNTSTN